MMIPMERMEKLGFLVHESPCSWKQVQENVVRLVILCTLWLYEVHAFLLIVYLVPSRQLRVQS